MNQQQTRHEPWRNKERHYCAVCNAWMGWDRQSVLLHENGKKHKENVEKSMQVKRANRLQEEKETTALQQSLQQMESSARQLLAHDLSYFATVGMDYQQSHPLAMPLPVVVSSHQPPVPLLQSSSQPPAGNSAGNRKEEMKEWEIKRQQRQELRRRSVEDEDECSDSRDSETSPKRPKIELKPDEGHYSHDSNTIYLEGPVFGDLLEEDMPIEVWIGPVAASSAERRLQERDLYWKAGLVAAVRKRPSFNQYEDRLVLDVAYLRSSDDVEETLETSVPLNRIRITLGADERLPDTLEEARLMAVGGEEIVVNPTEQGIDENTGLSTWSTVTVKRTTIRQELKEERERRRQERREAALEVERLKKETETRKMEEAKVASADDSALGAFDVWNRSKEGYKGVDIHQEAQIDIHEFGKKLTNGKGAVAFKKGSIKSKGKTQKYRTTSCEDD